MSRLTIPSFDLAPLRRFAEGRSPGGVAAAAVLCLALPLHWLKLDLGGVRRSYVGWDLPLLRCFLLLVAGTWAIASLRRREHRGRLSFLSVAGVAGVVVLAVVWLLLETVGAFLARIVVPVTIGRDLVQVGVGPGLWLAFVASLAATAVGLLPGRSRSLLGSCWSFWERSSRFERAGELLAIPGIIGVSLGRYDQWAFAEGLGRHVRVDGWAIPWIGPLTLLGLWAVTAGIVVGVVGRSTIFLLGAGGAAWAVSFLSAIAIIASASVARIRVQQFVPSDVGLQIRAGRGAWVELVAALVVAGAVGLLLAGGSRSEGLEAVS